MFIEWENSMKEKLYDWYFLTILKISNKLNALIAYICK